MRCHAITSLGRRAGAIMTATAVAAALALLGTPTPANASASPYELRVITHNIAGSMNFDGSARALDGVNTEIDRFGPDVVMLTEVCESQVRAFKDDHPGWHIRFSVMIDNQSSCETAGSGEPYGTRQGQMLASPHPISNRSAHPLGHPDHDETGAQARTKWFTLLCGDISIPGQSREGLRACVTHLRAFNQPEDHRAREAQTKRIREVLHDEIHQKGKAVTLGGDFNAKPNWNAMDDIYRLDRDSKYTGRGDFYEADQTDPKYFQDHGSVTCAARVCRNGQHTKDTHDLGKSRKIDYLFISRNVTHGGRVSGLAPDDYGSDHRLYRGLFEIQY